MSRNKKIDSRGRLTLMITAVSLLFAVCMGAAVRLVLLKGEEYRRAVLSDAVKTGSTVRACPGNILDTNGTALALTEKMYRLILDPSVMAETEKLYKGSLSATAELLAEAFSLSASEVTEAFLSDQESAYLRFDTGGLLTEEQVNHFEELKTRFQTEKTSYNKTVDKNNQITARIAGVWFEGEFRRQYPQGSLLSKVIGYTTADVSEGILGLELYYNDELRGSDGTQYTYVSEDGSIVTETEEPEDGLTLKTSLDVNVAQAVRKGIESFQQEVGGERVAVLVMKVDTGEILAMESDTEFDLNDPTDLTAIYTEEELSDPSGIYLLKELYRGETGEAELAAMSTEEQLEKLLQQVQSNFCVSGTYEPGSTSKTITLAAAIEEDILEPDDTFRCEGTIQVGKYVIHCHMGTLCGDLTPMEALGRSCNVCYVQIGQAVGSSVLAKYQELMNLGQKTGIDLPGEANTASLIYSAETMHEAELATGSFGQGFNVSMVQFAAAYCSLINGGFYYQPHVVTALLDADGNTVSEISPVLVRRTVSEETSEYLLEALRYVTEYGTAGESLTAGYALAGKTGAAEKLPRGTGKYLVSFISGAPADDPEYLIYAVVDEPHTDDQSMSWPAQHLARYCWENLYSYFNIYPSDEPDAYSYDWSTLRDFSGESDSLEEGAITELP